jgi:hypothetical protein
VVESADRFQVPWLDRHDFRLFEVNRDGLDEIHLGHIPTSITEALGSDLTGPHEMARTPGPGQGSDAGG